MRLFGFTKPETMTQEDFSCETISFPSLILGLLVGKLGHFKSKKWMKKITIATS